MRAGDSAHAHDDGKQHRGCHDLIQGGFEAVEHDGGQQSGDQVDAEPDPAPPRRLHDRCEHVLFFIEAGHRQHGVFGVFADHVHHVIDRDATQQNVVRVGDRGGNEVVMFELHGNLAVVHLHRDRLDRGIHQVSHPAAGVPGQQIRKFQAAQVPSLPVDDKQQVEHLRQFFAQPQVAQHHVQADIRPDGQNIRIHQAAGGVFRVGQNVYQPFPFLAVQAAQDLADDGVRQVVQNVGEIIQIQVVHGRDEILGRSVANQAGAHLVVDFNQHIAVELGIRQLPYGQALGDRE